MEAFIATCDDCGYRKQSRTQALAEHGLRQHSCEHQRALAARAERVRARIEDPGVKRDCQHKQAHHEHGTRNAYVRDRCTCIPCRKANRDAENARHKAQAFGRYNSGRVDAEPVREHLRVLMAAGIGLKRIAELAPVSTATLGKLLYGIPSRGIPTRKRTTRDVAARIMAVTATPEAHADGATVDGTGTRRRLQALVRLGYSVASIARRTGLDRQRLDGLLSGRRSVTARTARTVAELYDALWDAPNRPTEWRAKQAASRARNLALANGWLAPMAWDDIDDPDEVPEAAASRRGHVVDDLAEDVLHLLRSGSTRDEIAARLGRQPRAMERQLAGAGEHRLASWLRTGEEPARESA